jgi:hypothetical protein
MAQVIYRITCVPKFEVQDSKEAYVFKGTLEDILYKFGAKNSNPLVGYVHKGKHFIYKFYAWNGLGWDEVSDPRPQSLYKE